MMLVKVIYKNGKVIEYIPAETLEKLKEQAVLLYSDDKLLGIQKIEDIRIEDVKGDLIYSIKEELKKNGAIGYKMMWQGLKQFIEDELKAYKKAKFSMLSEKEKDYAEGKRDTYEDIIRMMEGYEDINTPKEEVDRDGNENKK